MTELDFFLGYCVLIVAALSCVWFTVTRRFANDPKPAFAIYRGRKLDELAAQYGLQRTRHWITKESDGALRRRILARMVGP